MTTTNMTSSWPNLSTTTRGQPWFQRCGHRYSLKVTIAINSLGAFHYAKISGNFGPNVNGTVRPRWKFSGQSGPPPEVVLFDRSVQSDRKLPFRNFRFQSRSSSSLHTVVKMADGSDESVYECSVCKLQTQDLNFLLMHSSTQGSGTAVHLNLFFLLVCTSF